MLQFLAIDTHGPLVTLSDADLMAAALYIQAWVLGGVDSCENETTTTIGSTSASITPEKVFFSSSSRQTQSFWLLFASFGKEIIFNRCV